MSVSTDFVLSVLRAQQNAVTVEYIDQVAQQEPDPELVAAYNNVLTDDNRSKVTALEKELLEAVVSSKEDQSLIVHLRNQVRWERLPQQVRDEHDAAERELKAARERFERAALAAFRGDK